MSIKARGIPQHVVDKLNFPILPDGYRWRVHKPHRSRGSYICLPNADDFILCVQIEEDSRRQWYSEYRVITDGPSDGRRTAVWQASEMSLVEALQNLAGTTFKKFTADNVGVLARRAAREQIESLWTKDAA